MGCDVMGVQDKTTKRMYVDTGVVLTQVLTQAKVHAIRKYPSLHLGKDKQTPLPLRLDQGQCAH